ncbi:hypothetical protein BE15_25675 [Sorangium cellulosum]|uniref:Uncharacterized protein n=1 Tax=Sorangium cellulosum TaxID=56 RepID=A0A150Q3X8_SORCE|nr:hypothetical protein BE15_25675 [Sorangium cellulosum]
MAIGGGPGTLLPVGGATPYGGDTGGPIGEAYPVTLLIGGGGGGPERPGGAPGMLWRPPDIEA